MAISAVRVHDQAVHEITHGSTASPMTGALRIVLAAAGSRGDVQPMVALGVELKRRGHDVRVCAAVNFRELVESAGLGFAPGGRDLQHEVQTQGEQLFRPTVFARVLRELIPESFHLLAAACADADVVVANGATIVAPSVAEIFHARFLWSAFQPSAFPSREHPFVLVNQVSLGPTLNSLSWSLAYRVLSRLLRPSMNHARAAHGLAPLDDVVSHLESAGPVLLAFDEALAPVPRDWRDARATGFWFYDDPTPLAPDVEAFLASGPPPIYVGFGSMPITDPAARTRRIVDAVEAAGARAILHAGWASLGAGALPSSVKLVHSISHAQLFPRVAAVVHHCGAGTTAAAARAGVPQVPVPHAFDQGYWASRITANGVGTKPLLRRFTSSSLRDAIDQALTDVPMRRRAAALGEQLRANDGVAAAAFVIEQMTASVAAA